MVIDSLSLGNFRSYSKTVFKFSPRVTFITGPNTAGKTNILEAIYILSTGKSFRADRDNEMVRWGSELSVISCQLSDNKEDKTKLEIYLTQGQVQGRKTPVKKYLVNGVPRRQIDFVGNLRSVLFWPEDLELVTNSPSLRRRYLDSILVQVDREYRRNLYSYERGLRQRNRLLDFVNTGQSSRQQLLFWNQLLIKTGGYLTDKRAQYISFVNNYLLQATHYQLLYDKSVISESRLAQYAQEEIAAKATLVGPHRDDFMFEKNVSPISSHLSLSSYGSRGEQRLAILWLKLAELAYIESQVGERPILLLDDIFSELDEIHRKLVWELVLKQQTIVASADGRIVPKYLLNKIQTISLK